MLRGSPGAELCSPCANHPGPVGWILQQTAGCGHGGCFSLSQPQCYQRNFPEERGDPAKKFLLGNICWIESVTAQPCEFQGCLWCLLLPHLTPAGMLSIPHPDAFNLHLETPREVGEGPGTGLTIGPAPALASFQEEARQGISP